MPAIKTPTAKKAASDKKTSAAFGPGYSDPKIDALAKRFEKTVKAMSAEAVQTVKAYHAGALVPKRTGLGDTYDFHHCVYPVLQLARYAELHWELMNFLAKQKAEPTKRNEKLVLDRREKLLDYLDRWEVEPLWQAYREAKGSAAERKAYSAYHAAGQEQRRVRLGLTKADFAKLCKQQLAEYKKTEAERKSKYVTEDAALVAN